MNRGSGCSECEKAVQAEIGGFWSFWSSLGFQRMCAWTIFFRGSPLYMTRTQSCDK